MNALPDAYSTMTDAQLVQALEAAESDPELLDEMVFIENEILGRLDVSLDETEQGLSPVADKAIREFIAANS